MFRFFHEKHTLFPFIFTARRLFSFSLFFVFLFVFFCAFVFCLFLFLFLYVTKIPFLYAIIPFHFRFSLCFDYVCNFVADDSGWFDFVANKQLMMGWFRIGASIFTTSIFIPLASRLHTFILNRNIIST